MIIVSGRLWVQPGRRQEFLSLSKEAMVRARHAAGCLDFVVAADPLDDDRVNIYEAWEAEDALLKFRRQGPNEAITSLIMAAHVARHVVACTKPA